MWNMRQHGYFDGPHLFGAGKTYHGTSGDNVKSGTPRDDIFDYGQGGNDTLAGRAGNDTFNLGAEFTTADTINGGKGHDTLSLVGDYALATSVGPGVLTSIEEFRFGAGFSYDIALLNGTVANGAAITVDGSALGATDSLRFFFGQDNATVHSTGGDGNDVLFGGAKGDTIVGGKGNDFLIGLLGADRTVGGAGADIYDLGSVNQSVSLRHDTVVGFDTTEDTFSLPGAVSGIDAAIAGGALDTASFNADLADAVHGILQKHHAVLFTPDSGDFSGRTLLIVDQNGQAGYQGGHDCVFELESPAHLGALSAADFTVSG